MSDVSAAAEGSSLLSTIAPGTPTPFLFRSSSGMLFSRKDTSGIPQKSVILLCSSTAVAKFSAASPVILLKATLHHQGTQQWYEKHREGAGQERSEMSTECSRALTQKRTSLGASAHSRLVI